MAYRKWLVRPAVEVAYAAGDTTRGFVRPVVVVHAAAGRLGVFPIR